MKTLILGAAIVDILMKIDVLPKTGEDIPCAYTATQVGGCAYNVAKIMALHKKEFDLFVPLGNGIYSEIIRKDFEKNHIKTIVKSDLDDNGYCLSLVEHDGERTFITVSGIESKFQADWFEKLSVCDYDDIYVAGYQVLGKNGELVSDWLSKQPTKTIFFAPGPIINSISNEVMSAIYECSPILHLNEREAISYTGKSDYIEAARCLYEKTKNYVIITLGDKGVCLYDGKQMPIIPSIKAEVVDTIGAGDSHVAAIIANYKKDGMLEACRWANRVSAKMVMLEGTDMKESDFANIK